MSRGEDDPTVRFPRQPPPEVPARAPASRPPPPGPPEQTAPADPDGRRGADPAGLLFALRVSRVLVWLAYAFATAAALILLIAFVLRLTAANPNAPFVEWVYRAANRLLQPFRSIYPTVQASDKSVLDLSMLFAVFMYGVFALIVHGAVSWLDRWIRKVEYDAHVRGRSA